MNTTISSYQQNDDVDLTRIKAICCDYNHPHCVNYRKRFAVRKQMMHILHRGCVAWAGGPDACHALFSFCDSTTEVVKSDLNPSAPIMANGNIVVLHMIQLPLTINKIRLPLLKEGVAPSPAIMFERMETNTTKEEQAKYDRNQTSLEKAFPSDYHRTKKKLPSIYYLSLLNRTIDRYLKKNTQQSQWFNETSRTWCDWRVYEFTMNSI
jgi:hypothetical protein